MSEAAENPGLAAKPPLCAAQDDFELPLAGFQGTPEEIERQWFEKVYTGRGDSMAAVDLAGRPDGLAPGGRPVADESLYRAEGRLGIRRGHHRLHPLLRHLDQPVQDRAGQTPMTILENNCMQSTASSAGYSTGGTLISAFAAYMMLNPDNPLPLSVMLAWVFFLAVLGVTMAIPMKRQMINIEQLRFPSGIAAAETLRALHSHGEKAARAAWALGIAGVLAGVNQFWTGRAAGSSVPGWSPIRSARRWTDLNEKVFGKHWMDRTVMFDWDPIFIAAGALTGLRVSASMLLGGTLCWAVFVPILQRQGSLPPIGFRRSGAMDPLGRRRLHGHFRPALLRPAMAERGAGARQPGQASSRDGGRARSEIEAIEAPDVLVPRRAAHFAGRPGLAGQGDVQHALLAKRRGRAAHVLPGPGGLPGDGRNRHHAHRRHGQGDATLLRGAQPGPHDHQPDERQYHGRRRLALRRSADRPEERLSPRRQPPQAVPRPVRRHFHGHRGDGALLSGSWCPTRRCSAPSIPRPGRADMEGRGHGPQPWTGVTRPA